MATLSDEVSNPQKKAKSKVLTCSYYNQGTCMHQKSKLINTSVPIAFSKLVKLTHIPNKIVGIRARK